MVCHWLLMDLDGLLDLGIACIREIAEISHVHKRKIV